MAQSKRAKATKGLTDVQMVEIILVVVVLLISAFLWGPMLIAAVKGVIAFILSVMGMGSLIAAEPQAACEPQKTTTDVFNCYADAGDTRIKPFIYADSDEYEKEGYVLTKEYTAIPALPLRIQFDRDIQLSKEAKRTPHLTVWYCVVKQQTGRVHTSSTTTTSGQPLTTCDFKEAFWCNTDAQCVMDGSTLVIKQLPVEKGYFMIEFFYANERPDGTSVWSADENAYRRLALQSDVYKFSIV
jgi:hypothetical protein